MTLRYNINEMTTGQADMAKDATRIDDILEVLAGQVGPLIERFVGDASTSYYAAQFKWDSQAADLNNLFVQGSNQVGNSAENMGNSDRTSAGLFHA